MSKILDKKMDKVLLKIAEVDKKMPSSAGPSAGLSAGPMTTNHEFVMELERQIREYELND